MELFKYREAQWSEANEAFDYFMAQLKERLMGMIQWIYEAPRTSIHPLLPSETERRCC
jgi:hypothetical protein